MSEAGKIQFVDLAKQQQRLKKEIDTAIARVLAHGSYILGPEITTLEKALAEFTNARHVITCSSGTDALLLVLYAIGIKPDDAVFVPSFTFVSTAEVVALAGAIPVFVDVDRDTFLIDMDSLKQAVVHARKEGLRPRAIIPVDLFGQPAGYESINALAIAEKMFVLADAAQSFGGTLNKKYVGTLANATATSFFPSKPLGCYGDGGAVLTDDDNLAQVIESLRVHGKGTDKYDNVRIGLNGRLDTIQAAILLEKLKIFKEEISIRQEVADYYSDALSDRVNTPVIRDNATSAWAQYTITTEHRDDITVKLNQAGIPSAVYYPRPLHTQAAYNKFPRATVTLPVSELLSQTVLSLPIHPYLDKQSRDRVIDALIKAVEN